MLRNPISRDALTEEELTPGMIVDIHHNGGYVLRVEVIGPVSNRYTYYGTLRSVMVKYPSGLIGPKELWHMGIIPNGEGKWFHQHYTTRAQ
jgi:hypothetical protein